MSVFSTSTGSGTTVYYTPPNTPPPEPKRRRPHVEVWKAADGWRWRFVAGNGRICAGSLQGYANRVDCLSSMRLVTGTHRPWSIERHLGVRQVDA